MRRNELSDFKGYIAKYYTVWCGKCIRWDDVLADRSPEKEARKMGWKHLKNTDGCVLDV